MRHLRAWIAAAMLCLPALQGAEPQKSMPPALLEAIAGNEPYASLVEYGLPLLNTPEEVEALPAALRAQQAVAIKKVLLTQMVRARGERHRISAGNYTASAQLAQELGAPAVFVLYQQLEAEGQLSPRARYAVREAQRVLCEGYRVDTLALRYFVDGSHLAAEELLAAAEWLPVAGLFNLTKRSEVTEQKVLADCALLLEIVPELTGEYAAIQSREQADATLERLLPLLERFAATADTRNFATPEQRRVASGLFAERLNKLYLAFVQERKRLQEVNYYDSVRLRVLDYLLN